MYTRPVYNAMYELRRHQTDQESWKVKKIYVQMYIFLVKYTKYTNIQYLIRIKCMIFFLILERILSTLYFFLVELIFIFPLLSKLDGVGPVDNRPSTD